MKQQVPNWAIIAGIVAVLGIIIFVGVKVFNADAPQSAEAGAAERAKHAGGGAGGQSRMQSYDPARGAAASQGGAPAGSGYGRR
jgi:hypothetical protein